MGRHLLAVAVTTLVVWSQTAEAWCEEETEWPVHVFVLQDAAGGSDAQVGKIHQADPDELFALSRLLSLTPIPSDQLVLPLPLSVLFLDAVELPQVGRKRVKHRNPLLKLNYSLSSADLTSPVRSFRLQGKSARLKFDRTLDLERGKVHLVQFPAGLFFVLTPDRGYLPNSFDSTKVEVEVEVKKPKLLRKTVPETLLGPSPTLD